MIRLIISLVASWPASFVAIDINALVVGRGRFLNAAPSDVCLELPHPTCLDACRLLHSAYGLLIGNLEGANGPHEPG